MKPKALVLQAYGTNRDLDVMDALIRSGADLVGVPLNELRGRKVFWRDFQLLVVPGGFSYADALGAGKLLGVDLQSYFADQIADFVDSGKPVIGICNGFQALVRSGILPGDCASIRTNSQTALTFNASGHFECRWVTLKPVSRRCIWTESLTDVVFCPVAHGEGRFQVVGDSVLDHLAADDQMALIYATPDGSPADGKYPLNPNGSARDVAGICNPRGNVLGLMPHPENHIFDYQHPRHTRGEKGGSGLTLFENGVRYAGAL